MNDNDFYNLMELIARLKHTLWGVDEDTALTNVLNDNTYNYRAWYDNNPANAKRIVKGDPSAHWPDTYKTAMHPTFSTEFMYSGKKSEYNPAGITGGSWGYLNGRDTYTPTKGQKRYFSPADLKSYFKRVEPGVKLMPYSNKFKDGKDILPGFVLGKFDRFANQMGPLLYLAMVNQGVYSPLFFDNAMRLLAAESTYGTSRAAKKLHNYGGVGWNGSKYTAYKDDLSFANAYVNLMANNYKEAVAAKDTLGYARALKARGYYEDTPEHYSLMLRSMASQGRANMKLIKQRGWDGKLKVTAPVDNTAVAKPVMEIPIPVELQQPLPTTYVDPTLLFDQPELTLQPVAEDNYQASMLPPILDVMLMFLPSLAPFTNNDFMSLLALVGLPGAKYGKDSGIHINPANKGKFNATKKRTGKTTEELAHSKNPLTRKRAIFAMNAKRWRN